MSRLPVFVQNRHLPERKGFPLNLNTATAECRCCRQRKPRKGGLISRAGFYCADCKGK